MVTKWTLCGLVFSGALHAGAFAVIEQPVHFRTQPTSTTVLFTVDPGESSPKPPAPAPPVLPDTPRPESRSRTQAKTSPVPEPPEPEAPTSSADDDPAADLTGITLTNSAGAGWRSATGDGSSYGGPLRGRRRRRVAPAPTGEPRGSARALPKRPSAPRVLPAADLSSPPRPPNLDGALYANYPESARAAGLSGLAVVRARISPRGVADGLVIVSESAPGFGSACLRTVSGSVWSAPIDHDGRPVSTEIHYRCRFRVRR